MAGIQCCVQPMIKALICLSIMSEFNFCKCHQEANYWEANTWKDCSRRESNTSINHTDLLAHYWSLIGPRWWNQNQQQPLWPILLGTRWGHCRCSRFLLDSWHHRLGAPALPALIWLLSSLPQTPQWKTDKNHRQQLFICHSIQTGILQPQKSKAKRTLVR